VKPRSIVPGCIVFPYSFFFLFRTTHGYDESRFYLYETSEIHDFIILDVTKAGQPNNCVDLTWDNLKKSLAFLAKSDVSEWHIPPNNGPLAYQMRTCVRLAPIYAPVAFRPRLNSWLTDEPNISIIRKCWLHEDLLCGLVIRLPGC
jgi:hypothetical protein